MGRTDYEGQVCRQNTGAAQTCTEQSRREWQSVYPPITEMPEGAALLPHPSTVLESSVSGQRPTGRQRKRAGSEIDLAVDRSGNKKGRASQRLDYHRQRFKTGIVKPMLMKQKANLGGSEK